jgi:hypothetical protein
MASATNEKGLVIDQALLVRVQLDLLFFATRWAEARVVSYF